MVWGEDCMESFMSSDVILIIPKMTKLLYEVFTL